MGTLASRQSGEVQLRRKDRSQVQLGNEGKTSRCPAWQISLTCQHDPDCRLHRSAPKAATPPGSRKYPARSPRATPSKKRGRIWRTPCGWCWSATARSRVGTKGPPSSARHLNSPPREAGRPRTAPAGTRLHALPRRRPARCLVEPRHPQNDRRAASPRDQESDGLGSV